MDGLPPTEKCPIRIIFTLMPALLILFCHVDAQGYYEKRGVSPDAYSAIELEMVIEEYQTQLDVLDKQIRDAQKDLDWLILKINRISDSGRKVPHPLKTSVASKEKKLALLKKQRSRMASVIAKYEDIYNDKKGQPEQKISESQVKSMPIQTAPVKEPDKSNVQAKLSDIEMAIKNAGIEDWVEVLDADGGCAKINNTLPILFSSGSATLAKEYKSFLKKLAQFLKPYDVKVYVNGFADPDPIHTKQYPSNFELGASRAANVVHEMVKYGLKPEIFKIGTTGEYRFAAKLPSPKKSFQRRAQVTIVFSS